MKARYGFNANLLIELSQNDKFSTRYHVINHIYLNDGTEDLKNSKFFVGAGDKLKINVEGSGRKFRHLRIQFGSEQDIELISYPKENVDKDYILDFSLAEYSKYFNNPKQYAPIKLKGIATS